MSSSARPIRSISRPRSRRPSACSSTSRPTISTGTASIERYAAVKERLVAQADVALVGVDDEPCRAICARLKARVGWPRVVAVSGANLRSPTSMSAARSDARDGEAGPSADLAGARALARRPQRPERRLRLCRRAGARRRARRDRARASRPFPASPIAWRRSGGWGACCSSTIRRRPTPTPPRRRCCPSTTSIWILRRQAEGGRHRAAASALSARRQGLSDRRGERRIRRDA